MRDYRKKIICVFVFEIIVYFLAYALEPFLIEYFHIYGSLTTGGWMFGQLIGAWVNLLVIPILTFFVMFFFVKEPWYWLLWIPIYVLMKKIYYPNTFYIYGIWIGNSRIDSVAVTVFVVQFFAWVAVMVATLIRFLWRRRKK